MKYLFLAAFIQALWGFTPTASRLVLDVLSIDVFIAVRFSIAALILWTILFFKRDQCKPISHRFLSQLSILGVFSFSLNSFLMLYGLKLGGVVNFALASSTSPLIVGLLAKVILDEKLSKGFFVSIPLYIGGIVFLTLGKSQISSFQIAWLSISVIALAYFCDGLGFIFAKKMREKISSLQYLTILQSSGALATWFIVTQRNEPMNLGLLNLSQWGSLFFASAISCCLLYIMWYWLLNFIEAHKLGFFEAFHVLAAAMFGFFVFHEPVNILMGLGAACLLISVLLVNFAGQKRQKKIDPALEPWL